KIGHIVDLTGVEAMTGEEARRSFEFAVKSIGGRIGDRPIEIVLGDAQSQSSVATDLARKMIEQDGVVAIFGPTQIGHKTAVSEYIKEAGIPLIFYNGTPLGILKSNDWLIGGGGATPQMPTAMADYVYTELGYRTVNVLSMDNTGYRSYLDPFIETFEALGGTIVSQQWAPIPCADWSPYLATLQDADAIVSWASGSDAISLWTAWYEMGVNKRMPIVAAMHGGFTDYFVPTALSKSNPDAKDAMLGALAPMMYAVDSKAEANQEFVDAWTEEFGAIPPGSNLPGACAQSIQLFKAAVEATGGETDPNVLLEALLAADVTGPEGRLLFEGSHAATKDVHIVKVAELADGSFSYEYVKTYEAVPPTGLAH
ncbi:MAG: ABC transporter substrate-binding protein, partial [Clostridiales Family XIII bacterium]|nr:ABC transporter substrate-binding protein [Clostridiales Family XIII bacterium]